MEATTYRYECDRRYKRAKALQLTVMTNQRSGKKNVAKINLFEKNKLTYCLKFLNYCFDIILNKNIRIPHEKKSCVNICIYCDRF